MTMSVYAHIRRMLFWTKDRMNGGRLWQSYRDVRRLNSPDKSTSSERDRMLEEIIVYAKDNTRFYSSVNGCRLSDFPVIGKDVIRNDYDAFRVPESRIPKQCGKRLLVHYTSGSTGIPFHVFQDESARLQSIATLKYYNDLLGCPSFEPIMKISMREAPGQSSSMFSYDRENNIWYADLVTLDCRTLQLLVDKICSERIRLIRAYMTIIDDLTSYVVDNGLALSSSPSFISIGELLSEPVRRRVVETMGLHIVSQYANEENGVLGQNAVDSPGDVIRLNRANHIIELLKLDSDEPAAVGEMGRVVVTDLKNRAMPMIRYDLGDLAIPLDSGSDGLPETVRLVACRSTDIIHRTDGSVGTLTIPSEIWSAEGLKQLQFEQTGIKQYVLHANTTNPEALTDREASLLRDILGDDAEVSIDYMDCPPEISAGKRRMIIQSCPEYKVTA